MHLRRLVVLGLLALAGCQSTRGPLGYERSGRADDPMLSIQEQKARGRERYAYVEDDRLAPRTYVDRPDPVGR